MMMFRILAALSIVALVGCSGGTGSDVGRPPNSFGIAGGELANRIFKGRQAQAAPDARQLLNGPLIESSPTSVMLVVVDRTDSALTMIPVTANLGTEQWRDAAGGGLLRRGGVLVGTRGLGHDLLSADVAPLRAALRQGGGQDVERVNRILNGENQVIAQQFICNVSPVRREALSFYGKTYQTTVFEESCVGDGDPFTNTYWVQRNGTIRQSRELVSPQIGALTLSMLKI